MVRRVPGDRLTARDLAGAALVLAFAAALRFHCLGCEALWLDEGFSWWDAKQSLADLWRVVPQCDPHPPLYAFLLKGWIALFGESVVAVRSLNAVVGVVTTGVVMLAAREIGPRTALAAGLLFAAAPFQVEFAHEARPYALLALAAALLAFGMLRILRTEEGGRRPARTGWIAVVVGGALALWSNNVAALLLAAIAIAAAAMFVFDRGARPLLRPAFVAAAAVALLWAPYIPTLAEQAGGVAADFWIPPPSWWRLANELRFAIGFWTFPPLGPLLALWTLGLVALWWRGDRREAAVLAAVPVLTIALNIAVSLALRPVFIARTLIGIAPAFYVALGAAVATLERRWLRGLALAALVGAQLSVVQNLYVDHPRKEPWNDIARAAAAAAGPDGIVLVASNQEALPLGHALAMAGLTVPVRGVPADFPAIGLAARYPSGKCTPSIEGQDLSAVRDAVRGRPAVVFITRRNNVYDPHRDVEIMLAWLGYRQTDFVPFQPGYLEMRTFVPAAAGR
ncbi:MAG: glycosyltransferase family 39 protein [Burkholderiales bacterium]|nr:glycosyltransferase family 39 protein [Burkholderiales bacterium]